MPAAAWLMNLGFAGGTADVSTQTMPIISKNGIGSVVFGGQIISGDGIGDPTGILFDKQKIDGIRAEREG